MNNDLVYPQLVQRSQSVPGSVIMQKHNSQIDAIMIPKMITS
jgi:hypothetical protein